MEIPSWWPLLRSETREWLMANNGDVVPPLIVEEIANVGGPSASDTWWVHDEGSPGPCMPDAAIDWVEEIANEETDG